jgi:phosphate/sulfate permease
MNESKNSESINSERTEKNSEYIKIEIDGFKKSIMKYYFQQSILTNEVYRYLMVLSAFLVCLSHGSNDVANAISPLIVLMK